MNFGHLVSFITCKNISKCVMPKNQTHIFNLKKTFVGITKIG